MKFSLFINNKITAIRPNLMAPVKSHQKQPHYYKIVIRIPQVQERNHKIFILKVMVVYRHLKVTIFLFLDLSQMM